MNIQTFVELGDIKTKDRKRMTTWPKGV